MVKLNRIVTKGGDKGTTSLGDGSRVVKHDPRVEAYGDVDELNALLGVVLATDRKGSEEQVHLEISRQIAAIQNQLFDVGADLCVPGEAGDRLRLKSDLPDLIEQWVDGWNQQLEALNSFILPAGTPFAAALHHARAVCRRAERRVSELDEVLSKSGSEILLNPQLLIYLNRLSDLLFVMARAASGSEGEVLWKPGGLG